MEMPRKIQLTGRNTYIVSLPHGWVSRKGVKKGDAVYLSENEDGSLMLSLTKAAREEKACTIDVAADAEDAAMRSVVSAYVAGAGTIVLKGVGMSTVAEEARRVLSGVEITDESADALTLRILSFEDISVDGIMKRAFGVTQSMFEFAIKTYREGVAAHTEISRKEDEVDRLYLLLLRTICISGHAGREAVFKAIAAKSIEKVSDHLVDICSMAKGAAPNPAVAGLLERSVKAYASAYQCLSRNELDRGQFSDAKKEYLACLQKAELSLNRENSRSRMLALKEIFEESVKILRYSEDIVESSTDVFFARMGNTESARPGRDV